MAKLQQSYYIENNTLWLAENLLGKYLFTRLNKNTFSGGIITETEAYLGVTDKASHAWNNRRTRRTQTMYQEGGKAYIYLCYGIHHLFNIVTQKQGIPHAILIRAIVPTHGTGIMEKRTGKASPLALNGPGKLTKALGITTELDSIDLQGSKIWIEDKGVTFTQESIATSPRIGIDYAKEHAKLPYRFFIKNPSEAFNDLTI